MPFTRPAVISDCVSLSDKVTAFEFAFVSEYGTVDALLSAVINELSPNEKGVSRKSSEDDSLTGTGELASRSIVFVFVG